MKKENRYNDLAKNISHVDQVHPSKAALIPASTL
jgi:hypothetical protein